MKHSNLLALAFAAVFLGSCQSNDASPTESTADSRTVAIGARLLANSPLPSASRVRVRLTIEGNPASWLDTAYTSRAVLTLGRVPRGSSIALDVRAYSMSGSDTSWKWFARISDTADNALDLQILTPSVDTIPSSTSLIASVANPRSLTLPAGSRYTLDGSDPRSANSRVTNGSTAIDVAPGTTLRALVRIVVPGTNDTIVGDTLHYVNKTIVLPPPARPSLSFRGKTLPSELSVGDTIRIEADSGTRLSFTDDGGAPSCSKALSGTTKDIVIGSDLAGKTVALAAISCRDTVASEVRSASILIVKVGEKPRLQIAIPVAFDSASGDTTLGWKDAVVLDVPAGSRLIWNLLVLPRSTPVTAAAWAGALLPSEVSKTGTGGTIRIDSALLGSPTTDSVATVLAVAVLSDSTAAQDTVRFRWSIRVPALPPVVVVLGAPKLSVKGSTVPAEMSVGGVIDIAADSAARLAYTRDGTKPSCASALPGGVAQVAIDSSLAGNTLEIAARSCRNGDSSEVKTASIRITKLEVKARERILIPVEYDSASSTAVLEWKDAVVLTLPSKSVLAWNLAVRPVHATLDAAAWASVGIPGTAKTGTGSSLQVGKDQIVGISPTDTIVTVLAVAVMSDSSGAIQDTARFRWKLRLPVVPKPALSIYRDSAQIVASWPITANTGGAKVWYLVEGAADTSHVAAIGIGIANDSFAIPAKNGANVRISVTSVDATTGRSSVASVVDTVALLAPRMPSFTVANIDTVLGTVQITLDPATRTEKRTTWSVGYAGGAITSFDKGVVDTNGTWKANINAGQWSFGVRAVRDGIARDSITTLEVQRTKGFSPGPVAGLALRSLDSSTVVWSWKKVANREYRVYMLRGTAFSLASDTADCLPADVKTVGNVDSFATPVLPNGTSVSIAVVALAGTVDSSNGNAEPVFSTLVTTKNPPPTPSITVVNQNVATGSVLVTLGNPDATCAWSISVDENGGTSFVWPGTEIRGTTYSQTYALNGNASFAVRAERDGYAKTTIKTIAVRNTNLLAPGAPSGLSWTRAETSLRLVWTALPNHKYRLFWDKSTRSDDLDTTSCTKIDLGSLGTYTFTTSSGETVRIALQATATDSTKPSALTFDRATALASVEPVGKITGVLTNPSTRIVTFSWSAVAGAARYRYVTSQSTTPIYTTGTTAQVSYGTSTSDVSISVWAVSKDDIESINSDATVHIPTNKGATNLNQWTVRTKGKQLHIEGRTSSDITGTTPDSVLIWFRKNGSLVESWKIAYDELATFTYGTALDSTSLNTNAYRVDAQFKWTSGSQKGDSTNIDTRAVKGYACPVPRATFEIANGKTVVSLTNLAEIKSVPSGWTLVLLGLIDGTWVNILDNTSSTYPSIATTGTATYPLGFDKVSTYAHSGQDTSTQQTSDIATDTIIHYTRAYPIVKYGTRRWFAHPLVVPTAENYCSDGTVSQYCEGYGRLFSWLQATARTSIPDSGDNYSQGNCPSGWRLPTSTEVVQMAQEVAPGWVWASDIDMQSAFTKAHLRFNGYAHEPNTIDGWAYQPSMWTSTTGTSVKQWQDLWYLSGSYLTAISRSPTFVEYAQVFCIEGP